MSNKTWFKKIYAYKLNKSVTKKDLESLIPFVPCSEFEVEKSGWCPILNDGQLIQDLSGSLMIQLRTDKKKPPADIVTKLTKQKVDELKAAGETRVNKKAVKEEITIQLSKNVYPKSTYIRGYFDNKHGYLILDTTSDKSVDFFMKRLQDNGIDIDYSMFEPNYDMGELLTKWLIEKEAANPFEIEDSCTLKDMNSGSSSSYTKQDLTSDEIEQNLSMGKKTTSLRVNWHQRYYFNLKNDFKIESIKVSGLVSDSLESNLGEESNENAIFVASMLLMIEDFAEILGDLVKLGKK